MSEQPKHQEESGFFLPRWAVPYMWAVIVLVIQILLPWVISTLGPRFGWSQQKPALWNFIGMLPIIMGLIMYGWCLSFHFKTYSASVRLGVSPPRLVTNGPYQVSRNPMYASGLFVWFGWLIFYGSPSVFIAFLLLYVIFSFRVIPLEEQQLEEIFGKDYLDYKIVVRRWLGRF